MKQVTLIRQYVENRLCEGLRQFISWSPEANSEREAMAKLQDPAVRSWIAAHVLYALGHRVPGDEIECSIDGCDKLAKARGLCDTHYRQEKDGREPRPRGRPRKVEPV